MLEDGILHPQLPLLVWLMMTSAHGYYPPLSILSRLLQIVYDVAAGNIQDPLPQSPLSSPGLEEIKTSLQGRSKEYCLIRSLLTRAVYGGMGGDIVMMEAYAAVWHSRFSHFSLNGIHPLLVSELVD